MVGDSSVQFSSVHNFISHNLKGIQNTLKKKNYRMYNHDVYQG